MIDFEVHPLDRQNVDQLYRLHHEIYGSRKPQGYFEKKYDTSGLGYTAIGLLALSNKFPVSFVGLIPAEFLINGQKAVGVQSSDTMTAEVARGTGIATVLMKQAMDAAREKKIDFVFGFGNEDSVAWLTGKCGFTLLHVLNRYVVSSGLSLPKRIFNRLISSLAYKAHQLPGGSVHQRDNGIMYTPAYQKYKGFNGSFYYKVEGAVIWLSRTGALAGAVWPNAGTGLYQLLKETARRQGLSSVTFMTSPGTAEDLQLKKNTSPQQGFVMLYKNLSGNHRINGLLFQVADCDIF